MLTNDIKLIILLRYMLTNDIKLIILLRYMLTNDIKLIILLRYMLTSRHGWLIDQSRVLTLGQKKSMLNIMYEILLSDST